MAWTAMHAVTLYNWWKSLFSQMYSFILLTGLFQIVWPKLRMWGPEYLLAIKLMTAKIFRDCIISCHFKRYNFPIIYDNQLEMLEEDSVARIYVVPTEVWKSVILERVFESRRLETFWQNLWPVTIIARFARISQNFFSLKKFLLKFKSVM